MAVTKRDFLISAAAAGSAPMLGGRGAAAQLTEADRNPILSGKAARLFRL